MSRRRRFIVMLATISCSFPVGIASAPGTTTGSGDTALTVVVDDRSTIRPINPLIMGMSGDVDAAYIRDVGVTLNSWGGNPSTRYNYRIGHAWNNGSDWEYRNTNYGQSGDVSSKFVKDSLAAGAQVRVAVPTLGWIAKNDSNDSCSFPQTGGGCGGSHGSSCQKPGAVADPTTANVPSTVEAVRDWVGQMVKVQKLTVKFIAMDNEPELWGITHYDVHPSCSTYEEILERYLTYATALREVVPTAKFMGPVMCCWYSFWNTAPGPKTGPKEDFLAWFLERVHTHDSTVGRRTLDLLDVHYYPQSDVFNDKVDSSTAARRLRSTRSLYDPGYTDESWISTNIRLIPRLRQTIAASYPGTGLAISEWNFGADASMNGALAIADVLGIYGREGVDAAAYWRSPKRFSPGYFAFKMHGNYDGKGSRFMGTAIAMVNPDADRVATFGAVDPITGVLRVMLINKQPNTATRVKLSMRNFRGRPSVAQFQYSMANPTAIATSALTASSLATGVMVPPSSITVLEFAPVSPPK